MFSNWMSRAGRLFVFLCVTLILSTGLAVAQEQITLQLSFWFGSEDLPYWQKGIDSFEKEHPNVNIEIQTTPWSQYWTKLQTQAVGGTMPDIVGMVSMYSQEWIRQGSLLNLAPYIERDNFNIDDFWPAIMPAYEYRGGVYAFPYDLSTNLVLGNVDMFNEVGVNFPPENWTWEEFLQASMKLTKDNNGDGRVDQWGVGFLPDSWPLEAFLRSNGGSMVNDDGDKSMLNSLENVETIQWWADLYLRYNVVPNPGQLDGDTGLFESSRVAMDLNNPEWVMRRRIRMPDANLDVAKLPYRTEEANAVHGGSFAISSTTKHPDVAWEFLKHYTSQEVLETTVALSHRGIPGRKSLAEVMTSSENAVPHSQYFLHVLDHSYFVMFNNWSQVLQHMGQTLDQVYLGLRPAKSALDDLVRQIDPLLK